MTEKRKKIEVVPYDSQWPRLFQLEAEKIKKAMGNNCITVHHVGSTSVPGLAAKPKIDIVAVVYQLEGSGENLKKIGIDYRGEYNIPMHYGFSKRGEVDVNLHVYQEGNPEIELNLFFRDYLRENPAACDEYAKIKENLLQKKLSFEKVNSIFTGYNLGKDAFIRNILKRAGFQCLRFVKCIHYAEWDAAKRFRQQYFFDKIPISDPYEWTFNHANHVHFVLYQGIEIIGYAHCQLWPEARAAIRIIVVDETKRRKGMGQRFLKWIEKWLKHKGYQSVHMESSLDALAFYENQGYIGMPFDDPDKYESDPRDIPMGKLL